MKTTNWQEMDAPARTGAPPPWWHRPERLVARMPTDSHTSWRTGCRCRVSGQCKPVKHISNVFFEPNCHYNDPPCRNCPCQWHEEFGSDRNWLRRQKKWRTIMVRYGPNGLILPRVLFQSTAHTPGDFQLWASFWVWSTQPIVGGLSRWMDFGIICRSWCLRRGRRANGGSASTCRRSRLGYLYPTNASKWSLSM